MRAAVRADRELTVDLETLTISHASGLELNFAFDAFEQNLLVNGLDDVALTLAKADRIDAYEAAHPGRYDGRVVTAA